MKFNPATRVRIIDTELLDIFQNESNKYDEQIQKSNLTQYVFEESFLHFFHVQIIAVIVKDTKCIQSVQLLMKTKYERDEGKE